MVEITLQPSSATYRCGNAIVRDRYEVPQQLVRKILSPVASMSVSTRLQRSRRCYGIVQPSRQLLRTPLTFDHRDAGCTFTRSFKLKLFFQGALKATEACNTPQGEHGELCLGHRQLASCESGAQQPGLARLHGVDSVQFNLNRGRHADSHHNT